MVTLDVGCGDRPRGDVNVDLSVSTVHPINLANRPNFVRSDAYHLPFADNSFEIVRASHILEHCIHPFEVLKELHRVSNFKIIIKVPSCLHFKDGNKVHIYSWTPGAMRNLCELIFPSVKILSTKRALRKQPLKTGFRLVKKISLLEIIFRTIFENYRRVVFSPEVTAICYKNHLKSRTRFPAAFRRDHGGLS